MNARFLAFGIAVSATLSFATPPVARAQTKSPPQASVPAPVPAKPQRAIRRLYLADGSFQNITDYRVEGDRVRFYSAERGTLEELPVNLVDLPKTESYNRDHAALPPRETAAADDEQPGAPAADDPQRREVKPHLRLDPAGYLYAVDSFRDLDELTPLRQEGSVPEPAPPPKVKKPKDGATPPPPLPVSEVPPLVQVNPLPQSAHRADGKESVRLRKTRSGTAVHIPDPVFYVRSNTATRWAIVRVRVDVNRRDRVLTPVTAQTLQGVGANALSLTASPVKGGVWTKLTPAGAIPIGEYALVEALPDGRFDEHVWDFAIDPTAKEDQDAIQADNAPKR